MPTHSARAPIRQALHLGGRELGGGGLSVGRLSGGTSASRPRQACKAYIVSAILRSTVWSLSQFTYVT
jgi:hypothetical protein